MTTRENRITNADLEAVAEWLAEHKYRGTHPARDEERREARELLSLVLGAADE